MNNFNVLIIDDHPLIANAYKEAIKKVVKELNRTLIDSYASSIDEAMEKINQEEYFSSLDLIFLDIRLPKGASDKLLSGEDIGVLIKEKYPDKKIIIATTFNDNYRIHSILKSVDPDGFLVKNDLTPDELENAIKILMDNPPFYSKTVLHMLRKQISDDALLDNTDRRLLYEISIGTKMKDMPGLLPLSKAGIERRKRNLKVIFDVENGSDRDLVHQAKDRGFI